MGRARGRRNERMKTDGGDVLLMVLSKQSESRNNGQKAATKKGLEVPTELSHTRTPSHTQHTQHVRISQELLLELIEYVNLLDSFVKLNVLLPRTVSYIIKAMRRRFKEN